MQLEEKVIEAYELAEFCKKAQEAFAEGFSFDFETNERYPTSFGSYYNVIMVRKAKEVTKTEVQEDTAAPTPAKRGPKPRN